MQWSRWFYAGVSCAVLMIGSSSAHGQTAAQQAEELFNKALELSDARNFAEACPLLAQSQKLDPTPGTLSALAECEVEAQQYASAVTHFKEYLQLYEGMKPDVRKKHDQRANAAKTQIKRLEPLLSTVKLTFAGGTPSGVSVKKDGEDFNLYSIDTPVPADPGKHSFVITYANQSKVEYQVEIGATEKAVVVVPHDGAAGGSDGANSGAGPSKRKMLAVGLLGAGAAGIALGAGMGAFAFAEKGKVEEQCTSLSCGPTGWNAVNAGRLYGNISTIGLAAGGALAVTGIILLVTAPKTQTQTGLMTRIGGSAGLDHAFLSVEGQF